MYTKLRKYVRQILLEKLSTKELEAKGEPTSWRGAKQQWYDGFWYYAKDKDKNDVMMRWIKTLYADEPEMINWMMSGENIPKTKEEALKAGWDSDIWYYLKDLKERRAMHDFFEKDILKKRYKKKFYPELDIPEKDLPPGWKKAYPKLSGQGFAKSGYMWEPGYGFKDKKDRHHIPYPGLDATGKEGDDADVYGFSQRKRTKGRKDKTKFRKSYEKHTDFFDSLIYVTWVQPAVAGKPETMLDTVKSIFESPNIKNELSATFYDMPPLLAGKAPVGLILEGTPTWVANSNSFTGYTGQTSSDNFASKDKGQSLPTYYLGRGGHREKSSGINKYPIWYEENYERMGGDISAVVWEPDLLDQKFIESTRRHGFDQSKGKIYNNEALIDNWEITGVVINDKGIRDNTGMRHPTRHIMKIINYAKKESVPVYNSEMKHI